jgi:hypothetical protein
MNCDFETIKTEVETMDFIQTSFSKFGATDTEPDSVYHSLLADAVNGADVEVPRTAIEWELYSQEHAERVAGTMASHTQHVVNLIQEYMNARKPIVIMQIDNEQLDIERAQLVDYLRGYCWRACVV